PHTPGGVSGTLPLRTLAQAASVRWPFPCSSPAMEPWAGRVLRRDLAEELALMRRRFIFAAMAVLVASGARAAEPTWSPPATEHEAQAAPAWASDITSSLSVGDPAPAFSYLGIDGGWHDSRGLWANGPVLLVFGAAREQLVELDRARSALGDLGVRTAAVLDMRAGSAAKLARRLELAPGVAAGPQGAMP